MWVTVTKAMIADGVPMSCLECPLALALRRLPGVREAVATGARVTLRSSDGRPETVFRASPAMRRFMLRFDGGEPVRPTRFRLPEASR